MKKTLFLTISLCMILLSGCTMTPSEDVVSVSETLIATGDVGFSGSVMSGEDLSVGDNGFALQYCITDIDGCIRNNTWTSVGSIGFPGAVSSGFILSGTSYLPVTFDDKPVSNNSSIIYFEANSNTAEDILYDGIYSIEGKMMKGVESIEVIWDGDDESYFLQNFKPTTSDFRYNISPALGNIQPGENKYLIRGYQSPNMLFERIYTLYYITGGQDIVVQEITQIPPMDVYRYCEMGYGKYMKDNNDSNKYLLGISPYTLAKQVISLPGGETMIYQNHHTNTNDYGEVIMQDKRGNSSNTKQYGLACQEMGGTSITIHSGGYYTIYQSYFEGVNDTLLYIPQKNRIISINEDLLRPLLGDDFYDIYSYDIQGDEIIITEQPYCCDDVENPGGYEEFIFNLQTQKLVSRKNIPTPTR